MLVNTWQRRWSSFNVNCLPWHILKVTLVLSKHLHSCLTLTNRLCIPISHDINIPMAVSLVEHNVTIRDTWPHVHPSTRPRQVHGIFMCISKTVPQHTQHSLTSSSNRFPIYFRRLYCDCTNWFNSLFYLSEQYWLTGLFDWSIGLSK